MSHSKSKLGLRLIQLPLGVFSLWAILYAPIALLWHAPLASIIFVLLALLPPLDRVVSRQRQL